MSSDSTVVSGGKSDGKDIPEVRKVSATAEGSLSTTASVGSSSTAPEVSSLTRLQQGIHNSAFSFVQFISELFEAYKEQLRLAPILTKSITSATIAIIGEIIGGAISCRLKGTRFRIDPKRVGVFGLYGLLVTGPVLHWWYGLLERIVCRLNLTGYAKTIAKLVFDRLIFGPPFVLYTIFFLQILQTASVTKTIENIRRSYWRVLSLNEQTWTVAQAVNFELVPVQYQVLFVNAVAIGWNVLLSLSS